ncbi:MAG: cytochrome c [Chitinophagaceae bacterium]|nr:cytochrome c [Chitinophagaceae bacterium]MBK9485963.1 cytochrome c [Chitinophagaceae bacterium]MBL0201430.1 cytochrome c [Chitinophagaceae bacterium]
MKIFSFFLTLVIVITFAACSKKASPAKVKSVTYSGDILPLLQAKCSPCHMPSKGGNKANFENYEGAKKYGAELLARVIKAPTDRGFMPKMNPKLSEDEIAVIRKWNEQGLLEK